MCYSFTNSNRHNSYSNTTSISNCTNTSHKQYHVIAARDGHESARNSPPTPCKPTITQGSDGSHPNTSLRHTYNILNLLNNRIYDLIAGRDTYGITLAAIQEHRWTTTKEVDTHTMPGARWLSSFTQCRAYHTVTMDSDHRILVAHVSLRLKSHPKRKANLKRNWSALQVAAMRQKFAHTFWTRYLTSLQDLPLTMNMSVDLQARYNSFVDTVSYAADEVLPPLPKIPKRIPVSAGTDDIRKERNRAKSAAIRHPSAQQKAVLQYLTSQLRQ